MSGSDEAEVEIPRTEQQDQPTLCPENHQEEDDSTATTTDSTSSGDSSSSSPSSGPDLDSPSPSHLNRHIAHLFVPSVGQIDTAVETYLVNQAKLKQLLEGILEDLALTLDQVKPPVDLEQYLKKINSAKGSLIAIEHRLRTVQSRLSEVKQRVATA